MEQVHILNFYSGHLGFSYPLKAAQIQIPIEQLETFKDTAHLQIFKTQVNHILFCKGNFLTYIKLLKVIRNQAKYSISQWASDTTFEIC